MTKHIINESISSNVGVFWVIGDYIVSFTEPISNVAPDSLGFVNPPLDHYSVWDKVESAYPELKGKEYFDVPRGRLVYNIKEKKFRLISSKAILEKKFLVYRIAREFHVPPQLLLLVQDEHYEISS